MLFCSLVENTTKLFCLVLSSYSECLNNEQIKHKKLQLSLPSSLIKGSEMLLKSCSISWKKSLHYLAVFEKGHKSRISLDLKLRNEYLNVWEICFRNNKSFMCVSHPLLDPPSLFCFFSSWKFPAQLSVKIWVIGTEKKTVRHPFPYCFSMMIAVKGRRRRGSPKEEPHDGLFISIIMKVLN